MIMPFPQFDAELGMLLRDQIPGISAEITDFAVAYWDETGLSIASCAMTASGS
jgi:hypothetical protein